MFKRIVSAALLFGAAATAPPALAQSALPCGQREALVTNLGEQYQEKVAGRGLQDENSMIEIFAGRETGTFTVLLSRADGISCVIAFGTNWVGILPEAEPEGVAG